MKVEDGSIESTDFDEQIESVKDRKKRIDRDKLLDSIAAGDFKTLLPKVAHILNCYPDTRNSDIKLALTFWQFFQPELYNPAGIIPKDLFKLERQMNLTRARAKIQNDFKLFLADAEVRLHRRKNEEQMEQSVLDAKPEVSSIRIFSDETGKNGNAETYLIVASVWVLTGLAVYEVTSAVNDWKARHNWGNKELHFNQLKKHHARAIHELGIILSSNREYLSFKSIAIQHKNIKRRKIEDAVAQLHERMVKYGAEHEINSNRVGLPRILHLTMDHESSIDGIALDSMKNAVSDYLEAKFEDKVSTGMFVTVDSHQSVLVQIADLLAGSLNRVYNTAGSNHMDDYARSFLNSLGIELSDIKSSDELDSYAMFHI